MSTSRYALDRYAVIGHPVDHSLSPILHASFAQQTGQRMRYDLLPAGRTEFRSVAAEFFAAGGRGLNVTIPFKEEAAGYCDETVDSARSAGAVNTIRYVDDASKPFTQGFNTDGVGLIRDITENLGWPLRDQHVLLLGAGGAARGAMVALLAQGCASITLANRTLSRAQQLVRELAAAEAQSSAEVVIRTQALARVVEPADIVINATSASLAGKGDLIAGSVVAGANCYDMLYADTQTHFCKWALANGAGSASDGLGMLVEQAAEAFYLWRKVRPDARAVLAQRKGLFQTRKDRVEQP